MRTKKKYSSTESIAEDQKQGRAERMKRFVCILFFRFLFQCSFIIAYCIFGCIFVETSIRLKNKVIKYSINFDTTRYGRLITIIMWLFHCASPSVSSGQVCIAFWKLFCYSSFCFRIFPFICVEFIWCDVLTHKISSGHIIRVALIEWILLSQSMSIAVLIFSLDYLLNLTFIWEYETAVCSACTQIWCSCTFRVCLRTCILSEKIQEDEHKINIQLNIECVCVCRLQQIKE